MNSAVAETRRGQITEWDAIKRFILGGVATFTIVSVRTGVRFTYKVRRAKEDRGLGHTRPWFVSLLRGSDNESDYAYMGVIEDNGSDAGAFTATTKSCILPSATSHKAFVWFWAMVQRGGAPSSAVEFWHEGRCCRCGRKLTVPRSISLGIGPECEGRSQ